MQRIPQPKVRRGFLAILFGFVVVALITALFAPTYIGGKPTAKDVAIRACKDYLKYVTFATTNSVFVFQQRDFADFEKGNSQTIFTTNWSFWIRTNFTVNRLKPEPAIICRRQFYYPQSKNYFGCAYSKLKPAYVVGYSDGKVEVVSQDEFASLSLSGFMPLLIYK